MTQALSLLTLEDHEGVIEVCRKLLEADASEIYKLEACALGGAAAMRIDDFEAMAELTAAGKSIASDSPDIALMEFLEAGHRYAKLLEDGGYTQNVHFLRPLIFRHSPKAVGHLLQQYSTRKAVARS